MMTRCIVNVATGQHYIKGQRRLVDAFADVADNATTIKAWRGLPTGCPTHEAVPYAFKAYALMEAAQFHNLLLWMDACIVPGPRKLAELWAKIERDGYWFCRNGYTNYEWTADSAYPDLFAGLGGVEISEARRLEELRGINRDIPHVVATAFGLNLQHENGVGVVFLSEYYRLAFQTRAFCGPWINANATTSEAGRKMAQAVGPPRCAPCGPPDVRGHRHDQTAASVIAWRLGMKPDDPPEWFAYKGGETDKTCLVADGAY